jgi:alpha-amylase
MEQINSSPLTYCPNELEVLEKEQLEDAKCEFSKATKITIAVVVAVLVALVAGMVIAFPQDSNLTTQPKRFDSCSILEGVSCKGSSGDMDEKFKDNLWNTPPRSDSKWIPGFQDMNVLTGYPQLKYTSGLKSCTVSIYTKTAKDLDLTYYFDDVAQKSNTKTFDSSYSKILKVKVVAASGEKLELDDIDFAWNVAGIKETEFNKLTRNGQKGAIVEMFGWPDDDVAQECKHIAEAGYMGVKLFPHQEQVMSYQPFENELNPWYFMYQPVSYRLQGRMGTRDQLRNMINTCRGYGVRVYADSVVNHMTGNGNDLSNHRNPGAGCATWGNKTSSAEPYGSPYYTPAYTYEINPYTGRGTNVLEFPAVPYGPMDFHCDKPLNSWTDPNILNTGWLTGLTDLDTSKDYVRQRIADFFTDLISIGFSGFRIDAAKHIHPTDLAAIFAKLKENLGGELPADFITWLEVLTGGESSLLVQGDGDYSYTGGLTKKLQAQGFSPSEIDKIKIWWSGYPTEPENDAGSISITRKVIQNDDHDQQNPGSSSRDMHDKGCVLVKGCSPDTHRNFEIKLFESPEGVKNNKDDYPIRLVLSSYYFQNNAMAIPDGLSDCSRCTTTCDNCRTVAKRKAYQEDAQAYSGTDYTRVHRDGAIIAAMQKWMKL